MSIWCVLLLLVCEATYLVLHGNTPSVWSLLSWPEALLALLALLASLAAHEGLHALGFRRGGAKKISFGVQWKYLAPYTHTDEVISARSYRRALLLPGLLLGVLPLVLGLVLASPPMFLLGLVQVIGASGDIYVWWLLRGTPGETPVLDHPDEVGCMLAESLSPAG